MKTLKPAGFVLALAVTVLTVGGCAETLDKVAAFFNPAKDGPAVTEDEIAALAEFPTAAGKADDGTVAALTPAKKRPRPAIPPNVTSRSWAPRYSPFSKTPRCRRIGASPTSRDLLARDLDIPLIARFVTGKHWKSASPEQRRSYLEVFTAFVVQTYSARLGGIEMRPIPSAGDTARGKRDILVRSRIVRSHGTPLRADWRLTDRNGTFRILDLSVEGISMALTLRQEFSSVLRPQGRRRRPDRPPQEKDGLRIATTW